MIEAMQVFENQTFDASSIEVGTECGDYEFRNCHFDNCRIGYAKTPHVRTRVRNVKLTRCTENASCLDTAIIEDSVIQDLKTPGLFQTFGTVFKRVVLRGKFERIMLNNNTLPRGDLNPPYQYESVEAFRAANAKYYRHVDWALDISQGEFRSLDIRGIPCRLIRRDPETQVVVKKERLLASNDWRELAFDAAPCHVAFHLLLDSDNEDILIIAPKRHRKFPLYMADLQLLRDAGIVEPD